jgi:DNA-binding response OmpR family regulator
MENKNTKRILIIEDEKILSEMYKFKLNKEGFEVISAIEVDEGIELAKKQIPDLVVLDVLLPKESGINYLIKTREMDDLKSVPVLFFLILTTTRPEMKLLNTEPRII